MKIPSHSVGLAFLWCAFPFLAPWITAPLAVALATYCRAEPRLVRAAILPGLVALLVWIPQLAPLWPLPLVIALGIVALFPSPERWPPRGRLQDLWVIVSLIALTGVALPAWMWFAQPDLSDITSRLPSWPLWALLGLGALFAVFNAVAEELAWRWVLWEGLEGLPIRLLLVVQAASFGLAHINGFPRGFLGVLLAGFYGLLLGWFRERSGGLIGPVVVHIAADVTIFALLLSLVDLV